MRNYSRAIRAVAALAVIIVCSCQCDIGADEHLAGSWCFDEGAGSCAGDSSDFGNHGVLTNMNTNTCWVLGASGYALEFEGSNDCVMVGTNLPVSGMGALMYWMKAARGTNETILHFSEVRCHDFIRNYLSKYGILDLMIEDDDVLKVNLQYDLGKLEGDYVGQALHVAWAQDGDEIKLYLNGRQKPLAGMNSGAWWTDHLTLKECRIGGGSWSSYFQGVLDEFKVFSGTVGAANIAYEYLGQYLCGDWHLDENTGASAADASDCGNHGMVLGSPDWSTGMVDNALVFDGVSGGVQINYPVGMQTEVGAIEFWMKADGAQYSTIFHLYQTRTRDYLRVKLNSDGRLDVIVESNDVAMVNVYYDLDDLPSGYIEQWLHVVWVQDGSNINLYINGEPRSLAGLNGAWWSSHFYPVKCLLGCGSWGYFDGALDEFKVYRRALGPEEVRQIYFDNGGGRDYGCESNPTGNPIGGGADYNAIFVNGDYVVTDKVELLWALSNAVAGDVVYVNAMEIDLSGETIVIPGGVTLAGNRGHAGAAGPLLHSDQSPPVNYVRLFEAGGAKVRITGLQIRGPHAEIGAAAYDPPVSIGINSGFANLEVDNCEISAWSHSGIHLTSGGTNAWVHHNYIHHCQRCGLGYGICLGHDDATCVVEANLFDYCRHAVAGTGDSGNSYEACYNLVLEHANGHVFDMHGSPYEAGIAGDMIHIHHNTVHVTDWYAVKIRARPNIGAHIHHNWFHGDVPAAIQINAFGNFQASSNLLTATRYFKSND